MDRCEQQLAALIDAAAKLTAVLTRGPAETIPDDVLSSLTIATRKYCGRNRDPTHVSSEALDKYIFDNAICGEDGKVSVVIDDLAKYVPLRELRTKYYDPTKMPVPSIRPIRHTILAVNGLRAMPEHLEDMICWHGDAPATRCCHGFNTGGDVDMINTCAEVAKRLGRPVKLFKTYEIYNKYGCRRQSRAEAFESFILFCRDVPRTIE